MIRRELKINFKSFILWTSILILMFLIVFLVYPFIVTDDSMKSLDEMMKVFPPDLLKVFNMDISSINTAYGWLKSEGFMFILIIVGIYSSVLGFNIVLKEEADKTVEYLSFVPVKRREILTNKIIIGVGYIVFMVLLLGIFNYVALVISGDFDHMQYILLSITPLFVAFPLFAINLFISTFVKHAKKGVGVSLGLVFLFYFINVISELSEKISFLRYFSIYTLADVRNVVSNVRINFLLVLISVFITCLFISLSYVKYSKKEFL